MSYLSYKEVYEFYRQWMTLGGYYTPEKLHPDFWGTKVNMWSEQQLLTQLNQLQLEIIRLSHNRIIDVQNKSGDYQTYIVLEQKQIGLHLEFLLKRFRLSFRAKDFIHTYIDCIGGEEVHNIWETVISKAERDGMIRFEEPMTVQKFQQWFKDGDEQYKPIYTDDPKQCYMCHRQLTPLSYEDWLVDNKLKEPKKPDRKAYQSDTAGQVMSNYFKCRIELQEQYLQYKDEFNYPGYSRCSECSKYYCEDCGDIDRQMCNICRENKSCCSYCDRYIEDNDGQGFSFSNDLYMCSDCLWDISATELSRIIEEEVKEGD